MIDEDVKGMKELENIISELDTTTEIINLNELHSNHGKLNYTYDDDGLVIISVTFFRNRTEYGFYYAKKPANSFRENNEESSNIYFCDIFSTIPSISTPHNFMAREGFEYFFIERNSDECANMISIKAKAQEEYDEYFGAPFN